MSPSEQLILPLEKHRNHYLFSDCYLNTLLPRQPSWREADAEAAQALEALRQLHADKQTLLRPALSEAALEEEWVRPVLDILGHTYHVGASLPSPEGTRTPDYALFPDEETRRAALPHLGTAEFFKTALAVGDAKRWDRSLDRRLTDGAGDAFSNANPSYQIDYYLRITGCDWGLLTNGRLWRLYHRESSFRLDVYYEVDLINLLQQGQVEPFKYFYLFFRRAAFPEFLNRVLRESREYAQGVSEDLKERIYEALRLLAEGFLKYPGTSLTPADLKAIHDNALILLYRLLFIFYAESRRLLPLENRSYAELYSLKAIKEEIARKLDSGMTYLPRRATIWDNLKALFHIINEGSEELGVPAYNGRLFDPAKYPFLEEHPIGDAYLVRALDLLARTEGPQGLDFVDYRDLEIRHLGSIYEGLLEYQLRYAEEPMLVRRERGREVYVKTSEVFETSEVLEPTIQAGEVYLVTDRGERKATGSYYTPDYIVKYIVENTLGPLVDEKQRAVQERLTELEARLKTAHGENRKLLERELARVREGFGEAVLELKVLDPAMGSGHFLVEATDYLAQRIVDFGVALGARAEAGDGADDTEISYWRRRVVESCIYGVDVNPLAVELAKLSLWLATAAKGKPLSFLDHHLRCGNSLIGARLEDLDSLPVKKRRGKPVPEEQTALFDETAFTRDVGLAVGGLATIQELASDSVEDIHQKERILQELLEVHLKRWRQIADLWVSAYFGNEMTPEVYADLVRRLQTGEGMLPDDQAQPYLERARALSREKRFFHWELEFPEVFFDQYGRRKPNPGFDAVVGNPPYVRSVRLKDADPEAWSYYAHIYHAAAKREFDIYLCFAEQGLKLLNPHGHFGMIMPNKWFTTRVGESLRSLLSERRAVEHIVDFGHFQVFEGVTTYTCLLFLNGSPRDEVEIAILGEAAEDAQPLPGGEGKWQTGIVPIKGLGAGVWTFAFGPAGSLLRRLRGLPRLEDITTVFKGTGTSADQVFLMERQGDQFYSRSLEQWVEIEGDLMRPSLTGRDIDPYYYETNNYLLFPYRLVGEEAYLIPPEEMAAKYPKAWAYLNHPTNRESLEGRDKGAFRNRDDWYAYGRPQNMHLLDLDKVICPDVAGRAEFACDFESRYVIDTVYAIRPREGVRISLLTLAALLNSPVMTFFLQQTGTKLRGGYFRMKTTYLNPFPIPRISFTTPQEERERLVEEGKGLVEAALTPAFAALRHPLSQTWERGTGSEGYATFLASPFGRWLDARLTAEPEQSDVVHDLLAHLAERMIEMNKEKQAEVKGFLAWLEREIGASVDDLTGKTKLRNYLGDYQKGEPYLTLEEFLAILRKNRRKLRVDVSVRAFQERLAQEYRASLDKLLPLKARLAATDRLIDLIVYRLYGLTEEEVAVVEGAK